MQENITACLLRVSGPINCMAGTCPCDLSPDLWKDLANLGAGGGVAQGPELNRQTSMLAGVSNFLSAQS